MTYSDYKKAFKQLKAKPVKLQKFLKHNKPKERKHGIGTKGASDAEERRHTLENTALAYAGSVLGKLRLV